MTKEAKLRAQERFGAAVDIGGLEVLNELAAAKSVDQNPKPEQGPGPQGFQDLFAGLRASFPDLALEVEHLTESDDDVAFPASRRGRRRNSLEYRHLPGHDPAAQAGQHQTGGHRGKIGRRRPATIPDIAEERTNPIAGLGPLTGCLVGTGIGGPGSAWLYQRIQTRAPGLLNDCRSRGAYRE